MLVRNCLSLLLSAVLVGSFSSYNFGQTTQASRTTGEELSCGFEALNAQQWEDALRSFHTVLKSDPGNALARFGVACAAEVAGDSNGALAKLAELTKLPELASAVACEKSWAHRARGELAEAEECLGDIVSIKQDNMRLLLLVALKSKSGKHDEVVSLANSLSGSGMQPYHFVLGSIAVVATSGHSEIAMKCLREMEKTNPASNSIRFFIAITLELQGETKMALAKYSSLKEDGNWGDLAAEGIKRLERKK